jgi:GGDEF domain-containing protein
VGEEVAITPQELEADLRQIQRRSWWYWSNAVVVIFLLAGAVVSLILPGLLNDANSLFYFNLSQAVRGLVALVLLFNVYSLYQQIRIKRLCDELAKKHAHAEAFRRLAIFDPLTGLYNRRFGEPRLAAEVARARRKGSSLTLLLLDLNEFKQINDRYGHAAGDLVLKEFARHLNSAIRGSDLVVRMGGDEFMVVLPDCQAEELQFVIGRLGNLEVTWDGREILVTFSDGWKEYEVGERP